MVKRKHTDAQAQDAAAAAAATLALDTKADTAAARHAAAQAIAAVEGKAVEVEQDEDGDGGMGAGARGPGAAKKPRKDKVNTTVFISSLPYTTTTTDLITHFSFVGPVRSGFVVKDRESGASKGVGYITYAAKEDADKAVAELNNGAFGDSTRRIRVEWAEQRPSHKIRAERDAERAAAAPAETLASINTTDATAAPSKPSGGAKPKPTHPADPNAIRTIVISGLPADLDKDTLWKKIRKFPGCASKADVLFPVDAISEAAAAAKDVAHVAYDTHAHAVAASKKLHAHVYKGALLSCVLKKRVDVSVRADGKGASRAGRLIVRNLHWKVTEQNLRQLFLPFGPILSINLPTIPSLLPHTDLSKPAPAPRARGFAFVWYMLKADAEKALEALNATELEGRKMAVDWALSKDKWEEEKGKDGEGEGKKDEVKGEAAGADAESEESNDEEEAEDAEDAEEETHGDASAMDVDQPAEEVKADVKPALPAVEEGSTIFIRNLPFEATEEELRNLFRAFGPLRYAKVTMDRATGRSKGTGFACFWKAADADKVLDEASRVKQVTGANGIVVDAKNPFALPSLLTVDPSASSVAKLVLHGRTLDVIQAVTREDAAQRKEDGARAREKADKRNTYLMREGVIFPNTPAAASLPETEVEKRVASFKARRSLLESNPALYISKTRLSIRQLPLFATDRTLKRLAMHAAREFDNEVKAGTREALTRDEQNDTTTSLSAGAKKSKRGERATIVIQSKIVRQTDKVDGLTGQGRSKGYGFLELRTHRDALKVLRWANNNPAVGDLMREWFAAELQDLEKRMKEKVVAAREAKAEGLDDLELRYKKLQAKNKEGAASLHDGMRQGKTLMIEFSVENIQVVKRRADKIRPGEAGSSAVPRDNKRKRDDGAAGERNDKPRPERRDKDKPRRSDKEDGEARSSKKPRRDKGDRTAANGGAGPAARNDTKPATADGKADGKDKSLGKSMGAMIGRKRKERRKGGK